jgi:hypothetical protein
MTPRRTALLLLLAATGLSAGVAAAADSDGKDLIYRKNSSLPLPAYIESETATDISYRTLKGDNVALNHLKPIEVVRIVYSGMEAGSWKRGEEEKAAGNYETAAERYNQVSAGMREWEKVYGSYAEGECWELAGKYADAAKAFAVVVNGFGGNPTGTPPVAASRLWLDAKYHLGMDYAQAKNPEAVKVADELEALDKRSSVPAAASRAYAIRCAIAGEEGNLSKFTEFMRKNTFRVFDELEVWFHFKMYCAEELRGALKKPKDAVAIYREMESQITPAQPERLAQVSLGLGLCLKEGGDKDNALLQLLKLDVLPYGSPDQKCVARFHAAQLIWEQAQTMKTLPDLAKPANAPKAAFIKEQERAARVIAAAAADGPAKNPATAQAIAMVKEFGPDPDAPKEVPKAPGAAATGPAPTEPPK